LIFNVCCAEEARAFISTTRKFRGNSEDTENPRGMIPFVLTAGKKYSCHGKKTAEGAGFEIALIWCGESERPLP